MLQISIRKTYSTIHQMEIVFIHLLYNWGKVSKWDFYLVTFNIHKLLRQTCDPHREHYYCIL